MSDYDTHFALARQQLLEHFGASGLTYTRIDGTELSITAIVGAEAAELIEDESTRVKYRNRVVQVQTSEVTSPRLKERLAIDGEEWTLERVLGVEGGLARALFVRPVRLEKGGRIGRQ